MWKFVRLEQLESVEKTRQNLEQQTIEVRTAVEEKLKTAAAQRDENIKKMLDRLKEHVSWTPINYLPCFYHNERSRNDCVE